MFFVLRHGQTDWNVEARLQGSTDIPLNDTGRAQARAAAAFFKDRGLTRIVTSPLIRAHETARLVGEQLGLEPVIDARLIERNFGLFEGTAHVFGLKRALGPPTLDQLLNDGLLQ